MKKNRGFIKVVLIIIIALVILSYFGIDIKKTVESPTTQDNISYIKETSTNVWNTVLKAQVISVWENILAPLFTKIF
jgi:hypothetical protein